MRPTLEEWLEDMRFEIIKLRVEVEEREDTWRTVGIRAVALTDTSEQIATDVADAIKALSTPYRIRVLLRDGRVRWRKEPKAT